MKSCVSPPRSVSGSAQARAPILVLGGGIAGLSAAWRLARRGLPVRVIEASPHYGGRIHSRSEGGGRLEIGMQFYYSAYTETHRLLRAVGLHKDLRPIDVRGSIYYQGRALPFSKTRPWLGHLSVGENLRLQWAVARQLLPLLRMSPFDYRSQEALDTIDVAEYFLRHGNERILEVAVRPLVNSYAFCEPEGHSLAMLLRIIKLGGLASTWGLRQGNDALPRALARGLDIVHARASQVVVAQGRVQGVVVERAGRRETLAASQVICALRAPHAAAVLADLPSIAGPLARLPYSDVILANLHLDRPLPGRDWVWTCARSAGQQSAFAIDLARRCPEMFPSGRSVVQVDFASPVSESLRTADDTTVIDQALQDMQVFLPGIAGWLKETSVVRRPRAMPSFACGMMTRVRALQREVANIQGLHLAGDYLKSPLCEGAVRSALECVHQLTGSGQRAVLNI